MSTRVPAAFTGVEKTSSPRKKSLVWGALLFYVLLGLGGNAPIANLIDSRYSWWLAWSGTDLALLALAITLLKQARHRNVRSSSILDASLWLLIAYLCCSMLWSGNPLFTMVASVYLLVVSMAARSIASTTPPYDIVLDAMLIAGMLVLLADYLYVFLYPSLGIESSNYSLIGLWKGMHIQKNFAGAVVAIIQLVCLECVRLRVRPKLSLITMIGAIVFLIYSGSKTSLLLAVVVVPIFSLVKCASREHDNDRSAKVGLGLIFTSVIVVVTIVAVNYAATLVSGDVDLTFTGRTAVWWYALEAIQHSPLLGYGYLSFWRDDLVSTDTLHYLTWRVPHAHNSLLDFLLSGGLVGLPLFLSVCFSPMLYIIRSSSKQLLDIRLFVQIWLFSLMHGLLESSLLLEQEYGITAMFMLSVFLIQTRGMYSTGR